VGGGDVHLLHVTFTPAIGRYPSQVIVQTLLLWLFSDFLAGRNRSSNSRFKAFDYRYVFFFTLHESALVMKWMLARVYWFVPSLSVATV
jgi:hypothetical protein